MAVAVEQLTNQLKRHRAGLKEAVRVYLKERPLLGAQERREIQDILKDSRESLEKMELAVTVEVRP